MEPKQHSAKGGLSDTWLARNDQRAAVLQDRLRLGHTGVVHELGNELLDAGQLGIGPVVDRAVQDSLKDFRAGQPKLEMLTQHVWMETQKVV